MTLEKLAVLLSVVGSLCGGVMWLVGHINKRAKAREDAKLKAKEIEQKLLNLEANYGRLAEDLEEVRKDFAQFVQQLLFKTK
jgi:membrane protein YqaA with SNARE-associated domain